MNKKQILFIYPSFYDQNGQVRKHRQSYVPSRTLPYLAALTPLDHFQVKIIDEILDPVTFQENADLVVLTGMVFHMPRAIDIAKEYQRRGKKTVIGGLGAYALFDHLVASQAFDSIILGEVDWTWQIILDDFVSNRLKKVYEFPPPDDLVGIPFARYDLLNFNKYNRNMRDRVYPRIPIETGRGCPNNCDYCLMTKFFGKKMRYRSISEVVAEIKYQKAKNIILTDDNLAIDVQRAKELFLAIKPLGIKWFGQFETRIIERPELLELAKESGCNAALLGIESINSANLISLNKKQNLQYPLKDIGRVFKKARIPVIGSVIFGLENDTPDSIQETVRELIRNDIDSMFPWILTPIPKTKLYQEFKQAGRLLTEDYSQYNYTTTIFRPKKMTPRELTQSFYQALKDFYSFKTFPRRIVNAKEGRVVELFVNFYIHYKAKRHLHPLDGIPV